MARPLLATINHPLKPTPLPVLSPAQADLYLGTRCSVRSELKTG